MTTAALTLLALFCLTPIARDTLTFGQKLNKAKSDVRYDKIDSYNNLQYDQTKEGQGQPQNPIRDGVRMTRTSTLTLTLTLNLILIGLETREASYAELVNSYYDLATEFYEWGWGTSFHFAESWPGESFNFLTTTLTS